MLRRAPVKKLSTHSTSWPSPSRRSHRWLPRKPAPPVTRIWLRPLYLRIRDFSLGKGLYLGGFIEKYVIAVGRSRLSGEGFFSAESSPRPGVRGCARER